jgi:hypothetical protein
MPKRFHNSRVDKGEKTGQGFLKAPAFLTKVGVFKYRLADGSVMAELRHPEDVFALDSIESLKMAPVTDDHPSQFVSPENVQSLAVGWIGDNVQAIDGKIAAFAVITEKNAIAKVDAGKVELSCGYYADVIPEVGTYDGESYQFRQKNIRYNHVALVDKGRAGPQVRLRLDADDAEEFNDNGGEMKKVTINGKEFEVSQEIFDAITAEQKAHTDAVEAAKKTTEGTVTKEAADQMVVEKTSELKKVNDELQAKIDTLTEKLEKKADGLKPEEVSKLVAERLKIERVGSKVLGSEAKFDGKTDMEIKKEVIKKHSPKADLEGKTEAYLNARFDAIVEEEASIDERRTQLTITNPGDKRDSKEFDAAAARERAIQESKDAWKTKTSVTKN